MNDALLSRSRLTAIAHRGGSKLRPENTLAAFDHARDLGVDAMECDVHLSRDGEVVVIHDAMLDRTTDATGPVADLTATALAAVDAGFHFGAAQGYPFRSRGCGVPRLADVLDRYRDLPLIVEVKGESPALAERTIAVIRDQDALHRVVIGGFSQVTLDAVRREAPELPTSASRPEAQAALTRSYFRLAPARARYQVIHMPLRLKGRQVFGKSFVRAARRGGIPVQAWIIDEADDMRRLIQWGVTGIISDRPDTAVAVMAEMQNEECRMQNAPD